MTTMIEMCPFCGAECFASVLHYDTHHDDIVQCEVCYYKSRSHCDEALAIAAHNKLARSARLLPKALELPLEPYGVNPTSWFERRDTFLREALAKP